MRFVLGPRVSRVLCNIQHGFPFRQFRGVLRSECHRCFSVCIYYIVVSVSVIPVDIYSNRVSIACFTVYWAVLFNIVLFARVALVRKTYVCSYFTNLSLYPYFRKIYLHKCPLIANNKELPGVSILKVSRS